MPFELPALPYAADALEPHVSARTFSFHHGKHHQAYVTNLNGLVEGTEMAQMSLEDIIRKTARVAGQESVFNNAAQVWNHSFFWHSMKAGGGGAPSGALAAQMEADFGSVEGFKEQFKQAGMAQFGSGWVWLVLDGDTLKIIKTPNAANPMTEGMKPLVTCDVWEHAYYLDYQNQRAAFLGAFVDSLINWDFVERNMD